MKKTHVCLARIKTILNKAANEQRALTQEELWEINPALIDIQEETNQLENKVEELKAEIGHWKNKEEEEEVIEAFPINTKHDEWKINIWARLHRNCSLAQAEVLENTMKASIKHYVDLTPEGF